jgi:hypothetical protein
MELLERSSWFLGAKVDGARDGSWRCRHVVWFYLAANPSHVGVDMDGLVCPLHCPTAYGCQPKAQSLLSDTALLYLVINLLLRVSLPKRARTLQLSGWGTESLDRRCLVQLPCVGQCRIQTVSSRG